MTPATLSVPEVVEAGLRVDALREEEAWAEARHFDQPFVARFPTPGAVPVGHTDVWVMTDPRGIYLFAEMTDPEPQRIRASLARRDTQTGDSFGVYLDPAGTAQRAYLFSVNAGGVQRDATATGEESDSWSA